MRLALALLSMTTTLHAQWQVQQSNTTADLRGIHSLGGGVAWASGSKGTVLRTTDVGKSWQPCTMPSGAEELDFRGVQAFDAQNAIVMSSGKGSLSRLYKTTDGCKTWMLVLTNPDASGFFDAVSAIRTVHRSDGQSWIQGVVIGDPVDGTFVKFYPSPLRGDQWEKAKPVPGIVAEAKPDESLFAASNSSLIHLWPGGWEMYVTGGKSGSRSRILSEDVKHDPRVSWKYVGGDIPLARGESAGAFSVATSYLNDEVGHADAEVNSTVLYFPRDAICVAVGGDYKKPDQGKQTAAVTIDGGLHWKLSDTQPHGYRSALAYSPAQDSWITVGPNGTDLSTDGGRNWRPLRPGPQGSADEDQHWNALSLPFVVGPHGRIGILRDGALKP